MVQTELRNQEMVKKANATQRKLAKQTIKLGCRQKMVKEPTDTDRKQ